jgi:alpha-mannosidase
MSLNAEKLRKITTERIEKFLSKEAWTDINLFSKLYKARDSSAVTLAVYSVPDTDPNQTDKFTYDEAIKQQFVPTQTGQSFGPTWSTHWFKGPHSSYLSFYYGNFRLFALHFC